MDVDEYEQFLKGSSSFLFRRLTVTDLAQQKELENRVRELQDFRAAGLTKLEQIEQFSEEKKHNRVSQTLLSVAYVHRNRGQDPTLPRSVLRLLHRPLFRTVPNANSRLFHLHLQPSRTPVLLQMWVLTPLWRDPAQDSSRIPLMWMMTLSKYFLNPKLRPPENLSSSLGFLIPLWHL